MYVAYVPDLAFDLLLLMTAHKQGVGFMTEDENFSHATEVARQSGFLILPHATDSRNTAVFCITAPLARHERRWLSVTLLTLLFVYSATQILSRCCCCCVI